MLTQTTEPPLKSIIKLYKPISLTSLDLIKLWRINNPEYRNIKLAYAGRLDPMAHGLMIVLVGNECKKQQLDYHGLDKKYIFKVLWGWQSDTYDVMGILKDRQLKTVPKNLDEQIRQIIPQFLGKQLQPFPHYSARPVNGQPLMYWARKGKIDQIKIPKKEIEIYNLQYLGTNKVKGVWVLNDILNRIRNVKGRFRQELILQQWSQLSNDYSQKLFHISTFKAYVSSGTYIRTLVHQIGQQLKLGSIAWDIFRTQLGGFNQNDALIVEN